MQQLPNQDECTKLLVLFNEEYQHKVLQTERQELCMASIAQTYQRQPMFPYGNTAHLLDKWFVIISLF